MKTSIRVGVGIVVAAIVLSGVVGVTPASAACTAQGSKGDTSSLSWTRAMSNDCAGNVQTRGQAVRPEFSDDHGRPEVAQLLRLGQRGFGWCGACAADSDR